MDGDNVSTISETTESEQVANTVKGVFFDLIVSEEFPTTKSLFQLNSSGNVLTPTHMSLPENVHELEFLRYDVRTGINSDKDWRTIEYCTPHDFLARLQFRNASESTVTEVTDPSGVIFNIKTNESPTYYTSFDDENIVMDSYNNALDTTLQSSKTVAYGVIEPAWVHSDTFIPDLPSKFHQLLLREAQALCMSLYAQEINPSIERIAKRNQVARAKHKHRATTLQLPLDFGRK